jgi:hypothetical protein
MITSGSAAEVTRYSRELLPRQYLPVASAWFYGKAIEPEVSVHLQRCHVQWGMASPQEFIGAE